MPEEDIEDIKKLSPKERIERLKELKKRHEEEIKEAQKLMSQSEEEAEIEEELERIPIPQLKAVDIGSLFTEEERDIFRAKRYDIKREASEGEKEESLEEAVAAEPVRANEEEELHRNIEYIQRLSREPASELHERMENLYNTFNNRGYLTRDQWEEIDEIESANEQKLRAIERGIYSDVTREVADQMIETVKMGNLMQRKYKAA